LSAGLKKFIGDLKAADRAGHGELPVQDFLAGVSKIKPTDEAALNHRGSVKVIGARAGLGTTANDGQAPLEFQAVFAYRQTFFRVPQHIRSQYVIAGDVVTLNYDAAGALQFGEAVPLVGIPFYRTLEHAVITPDKLLFFWQGNSSPEADRCYVSG
jgi:hypothetical protein